MNNHSDRGVGKALAERLGLQIDKIEGHDLAGPYIACESTDAFRLHQDNGVGYCYSCGANWSPFQLAEAILGDREQAKALLVELGIFRQQEDAATTSSSSTPAHPIALIATQKGISRDSLVAYGAGKSSPKSISIPAYGPNGTACTTFSMSIVGGKGRFARGKRAGLFFPHVEKKVRLPQPDETWHLVEGVNDAAALHDLGLLACGLNTSRLAAKFARLFSDVDVVLVPDRDSAGEKGAQVSGSVLHGVARSVGIATLPVGFKKTKGSDVRDVLKLPDGRDLVMRAIVDAKPWQPSSTKTETDQRAEIVVTPDEHLVNDEAGTALENDKHLFQRSSVLVQIVRDHGADVLTGVTRPPNTPRIVTLKDATLRERLSAVARFVKIVQTDDGNETVQIHPPVFCTRAVGSRGYWPSVRHLEGVISSPILRNDGTVLTTPGYDVATGLYYEPDGCIIDVIESPTRDDSRKACAAILEVVEDFPFAQPAYRAAWLALVLTPLGRHAFSGPSPLFLIDANIRASGKSLLADVASLIVTGRPMARMSCPDDDDEMRKRITAITLGGDQMVLIDNIAGELGSASLDAALTGVVWKDRILGRSEIIEMPLMTTWAATGNNVALMADTSRRVCHIRLDSRLENPEEREDFQHPHLQDWVAEHRPKLLSDALTILSAYCRSGRPDQHLKTWGSFEGWSHLVRQALVWAGLPDPGETREELARSSDREAAALRGLLEGWPEVDPDGIGLTSAKLIDRLEKSPDEYDLLRNAILELCPAPAGKLPGSRSVGNKLRHLRGRVVGGKSLEKRDIHGTAAWYVADVTSPNSAGRADAGCSGGSGCSGSGRSEFASTGTPGESSAPDAVGEAITEQLEQPLGVGDRDDGGTWEEGQL